MSYQIIFGPAFRDDLDDHLTYLRTECVGQGVINTWYNGLFERIDSLEMWPNRFAVDEAYSQAVGRETRKLTYKKYVVMYQVDDENRRVELVAFMHGAKRK